MSPVHLVARDWVTGEGLYGELVGGVLYEGAVDVRVCDGLGEHTSYECAIGDNRRLWVRSATARDMVLIGTALCTR
jgi:hypothetical protein